MPVNTVGARHSERQTHDQFEGDHYDDIEENMLNEIYQKATEVTIIPFNLFLRVIFLLFVAVMHIL